MSSVTIKSILLLIAVSTGLLIFGVIIGGYYTAVVLPPVLDKLDRGYEKIIQTQEIQNATDQRNLIIYGSLFNKIANNSDVTLNLTKTLNDRATAQNAFRNLTEQRLIDATNDTNTLVKFLTDNFGAKSGYLERENFQYARANQTFEMIKQILNQTR